MICCTKWVVSFAGSFSAQIRKKPLYESYKMYIGLLINNFTPLSPYVCMLFNKSQTIYYLLHVTFTHQGEASFRY